VSRPLRTWGPALVWTLLLFAASSLRTLPVPLDGGADKFAHFGAYMVLGILLAHGFSQTMARIWPALPVGSLIGALDELYQGFVPGRAPEIGDWVADTLGVAAGLIAYHLMIRAAGGLRRRSTRPPQPQDG
jgi:VanZ family protein